MLLAVLIFCWKKFSKKAVQNPETRTTSEGARENEKLKIFEKWL